LVDTHMKPTYRPTWESLKQHTIPDWYQDCKLGIFIHWGLYSVPAFAPPTVELGVVNNEEWFCNNPYAEWYFNSVNIGRGPSYEHHIETYGKDFPYENFADMWKAEKFDPAEWATLFKEAGAGYVVLVTKHHDGFCLFPSKYTDYHAGNRGPMRDLVGELSNEVRDKGMKMGLYYSGIIDWRFASDPIFTDDQVSLNCSPTYEYADYAYKQSLELIDRYHPSLFWNDIGWPFAGERNLPYLLAHYYNTCEDGLVNDRFNGLWKDFSTKEYQYGTVTKEEKWEMCRGLGLSFGYNAVEGDEHILSVEKLISLLVSTVANNGNLLINIGPKADGTIPKIQAEKLQGLGSWLKINGEAIYKTRCSERNSMQLTSADVHFTETNDALYLILDNLKDGTSSVLIPSVEGEFQPLDKKVNCEVKKSGDGIEITILEHTAANGAVAFKAVK